MAASVATALELPAAAEILDALADTARVAFGAAACGFARVDESAEELEWIASSGEGSDRLVGMRMPVTDGLAGYAATAGETLAIEDVRRDPRFALQVAETVGYIPDSLLAAPVLRGDRVLGVFEALDRTRPEGAAALDLAARFARVAAGVWEIDAAVRDVGRVVLEAAARAVALDGERPDVVAALQAAAAASDGPDTELVQLAAALAALGRLGPRERALAVRVVGDLSDYATSRRSRR